MASHGPSPKWFAPRPAGSEVPVRLFCLPHAGSGAAIFYRWKRLFPSTIEVAPILLPGRETRFAEPFPVQADDLVGPLTRASRGQLDAPYAIFGHSMGALLAYAWACGLHGAGLPAPVCLFLSGKDAAHLPCRHNTLHTLPDDELIVQLDQRFGLSGASAALLADAELRAIFLPTLRADLNVVDSYRHRRGPLLECPFVVLAGSEDRSVSTAGLAAWAELTRGPVNVARLPGDHFYHVDPGHSRALLATIVATLTGEPPTSAP